MKRTFFAFGLFSAIFLAAGYGAQPLSQAGAAAKAPAEPDLNDGVARSPAEVRNGVATLAQVRAFLGVTDEQMHGEPVWEIEETDVDLDGAKDLLIANVLNDGVGGHNYAVFLKTPKGYRYIGGFQGFLRTLPVEKEKPVRFVISAYTETAAMAVELAELQANGLHRLAKTQMTTAGCDAKDNPVYQEVVCSEKAISADTLKKAFPGLPR